MFFLFARRNAGVIPLLLACTFAWFLAAAPAGATTGVVIQTKFDNANGRQWNYYTASSHCSLTGQLAAVTLNGLPRVYGISTDGVLSEMIPDGANGAFNCYPVGGYGGAPHMRPGTSVSAVVEGTSVHVFAVTNSGALWDVVRAANGAWSASSVTNAVGATSAPLLNGELAAVMDGTQVRVVGLDKGGNPWEFVRETDTKWAKYDINTGTLVGNIALIVAGGRARVYGVDAAGDLREGQRNNAGGRMWNNFALGQDRSAPTMLGQVAARMVDGSAMVFSLGRDGKVWQFVLNSNGTWSKYALSDWTNGVRLPTLRGDLQLGMGNNQLRLYGESPSGEIWEIIRNQGGGLWGAGVVARGTPGPDNETGLALTTGANGYPQLYGIQNDSLSSTIYGGANYTIDTPTEADAVNTAMSVPGADSLTINNGLSVRDRAYAKAQKNAGTGSVVQTLRDDQNGRSWGVYPSVSDHCPFTGQLSSVTLDGSPRVYGISTDGTLTEMVPDGSGGNTWNCYPIGRYAGAPKMAAGTSVAAVLEGTAVHVFSADTDGTLWESVRSPGGSWQGAWAISQAVGIPAAAKIGGEIAATMAGTQLRVVALGADGRPWEYVRDNVNGRLWNAYDINTGPLVGDIALITAGGFARMYGVDAAGKLHEGMRNGASGRMWNDYPLGDASGAPAMIGEVTATSDGGTPMVFSLGRDGKLWQMVNNGAGGRDWNAYLLANYTNSGSAVPQFRGELAIGTGGNQLRVYGVTTEGELWEVFRNPGGGLWNAGVVHRGVAGPDREMGLTATQDATGYPQLFGIRNDDRNSWFFGGVDYTVNTAEEADAVIAKLRSLSDAEATTWSSGLSSADRAFVQQRAQEAMASSAQYGGANLKLDASETASWATAFRSAADDSAAYGLYLRLAASDRTTATDAVKAQASDATLVRDVATGRYWSLDDGLRMPFESLAALDANGFVAADAIRVVLAAIDSRPLGETLPADGDGAVIDPSDATRLGGWSDHYGYSWVSDLTTLDTPLSAEVDRSTTVRWAKRTGFLAATKRATFDDLGGSSHPRARALEDVACIAVRLTWSYGRFKIKSVVIAREPSVDVELGTATVVDGWMFSCRKGTKGKPPYMDLTGIGYKRKYLKSGRIELCAADKSGGTRRWCDDRQFQPNWTK
jgi:hypothetical protein